MSYIAHLNPEKINLTAAPRDAVVAACNELHDLMGLSVAYSEEMTEEETAAWLSEAMDEMVVNDHPSDETIATLSAIGFIMPNDPNFNKESDNGENQNTEAAEVPAEAEVEGDGEGKKAKKPVKAKKEKAPKEPKAKKEPKPKKEKAPKAPKAPGVIATLREFVKEHGAEGFTVADAHSFICAKFPDHAVEKLLATCRVQLQNSRMGKELGLKFSTVKNKETKVNTIYAVPAETTGEIVPAAE